MHPPHKLPHALTVYHVNSCYLYESFQRIDGQGNSAWTVLGALQHYSFNVNGCNPLESVLRHANVVLQNTGRLSRVNCF